MSGNGTATRKHTSWLDWIQPVGTILQTVAVLVGIGFAIYELNQARQAYQAATVSDIHGRTAELQWRVIDDPNLAPLLLDPATPEAKRAVIAGIVINEFATMFDLWKLGGIPDRAWEGFEKDIVSTMSTEYFSSRWRQVRRQHGSEFRGYIDEILGLGEE